MRGRKRHRKKRAALRRVLGCDIYRQRGRGHRGPAHVERFSEFEAAWWNAIYDAMCAYNERERTA